MAKKGGQQQLQAEINTDDDLEKFIEREGLIIFDIYSEWCGPCLGMVGTLRKIKLEIGGDSLHLAVCKCDTVETFKRFRNMSEPTWLFVTQGKAVNLLFGSNVPKLIGIVTSELAALNKPRTFYELTEMQPEEVERFKAKKFIEDEAARIEQNAIETKRREYLTHVTDEIMNSLPDFGVTIFGPQVNRDMFKKVMEPAEAHKLQCKDRKVITITVEDLRKVNFASDKPLEGDILEQMLEKELLLCFWKVSDDDHRPLEEVFTKYIHDLTKKQDFVNEAGEVDPEIKMPPILSPIQIKVKIGIEKPPTPVPSAAVVEPVAEIMESEDEEYQGDGGGEGADEVLDVEEEEEDPDLLIQEVVAEAPAVEEEPSEEILKIVTVPPVWVPDNKRTHAAAIYTFFRSQTVGFLPPDPPPEPPHIIMAFDAYKKRDIAETMTKFPEDILLYGFFTSEDPDNTELVANSLAEYEQRTFNVKDRIVLKVAKKTSHVVLALATNNPVYISPNTVEGKKEALKFFPEGYKTGEMTNEEEQTEKDKSNKKKKKGKGDKKDDEGKTEEGTDRLSTAAERASASAGTPGTAGGEQVPGGDNVPAAEHTGEAPVPAAEGMPATEGAPEGAPTDPPAAEPASEPAEPPPPTE